MEIEEQLKVEDGSRSGCVSEDLAETCDLHRLSEAQVIKRGAVGERATEGTETLSTAPASDSG